MEGRRRVLKAALAAGTLLHTRFSLADAVQHVSPVRFAVPAGACDCHTHIHGDPAKFPFFSGRVYTPEMATPEQMLALHKALGIQRVVIVTPSVYGTDNAATLWGMQARGRDARGVAVIDEKTSEAELDSMHKAGVRGIRLNLTTGGTNDPDIARKRFEDALTRVKHRKWHIQFNTRPPMIAALKDALAASPVPLVFDHFGGARPELGVQQPGFYELAELVHSGKAYVKISVGSGPRDTYAGYAPLARALIAANPARILWGTNWPHPNTGSSRNPTEVTPLMQVDNGLVFNLLPMWAPDATLRNRILVKNPARLYEF
ncbi:MAG: transcriptional regulator, GntR family/amidohydrolase family [Betaproteobacteria bacterium]|jgi:predicted TIM-barrel fold metal-dependent hydrolase|nr:transcriptional regulator, GntR family/amidohydrolase family [Betaproteobacteria bacterium]